MRELQQRHPEHEYHLFSATVSNHPEVQYFLDASKFIIHTSNTKLNGYWRSYGCTALMDNLELDIYHGLSHELPFNIKKSRVKSIVSFHDLIYEKHPNQFGLWDRTMYKWKYPKSARIADKVVAISESTKRDLIEIYQLPKSKMEVIYQGQSVSKSTASKATQGLKLPSEYWLSVGSIIPRKRLEDIVLALATTPQDHRKPLVVVGTGKAYKEHVDELINQHLLHDDIIFLGQVSNDALYQIYNGAIALIYPSIYEGFGIPLIEAIASGTPVIAANASSLPEAGGDGAIFFEAKNVEELQSQMLRLQDDEVLRDSLVEDGQKYISEKFDHTGICEAWEALYQKLATQ